MGEINRDAYHLILPSNYNHKWEYRKINNICVQEITYGNHSDSPNTLNGDNIKIPKKTLNFYDKLPSYMKKILCNKWLLGLFLYGPLFFRCIIQYIMLEKLMLSK